MSPHLPALSILLAFLPQKVRLAQAVTRRPAPRLPALTRPRVCSYRCLQRHLLRAWLLLVGPGRCDWASGGGGAGWSRGGAGGTDWPRPTVYHVIFIYCAVKGHRGFQFFYLPYFDK